MFRDTTAFEKIEALQKRISVIQGGTSAGKTISLLFCLIDLSFEVKNKTISIVSDTFPNLRRGALKDLRTILAETERDKYFEESKSLHTFTNRVTGTILEFFSTDEAGGRGARRDFLFVNEANRIDYATYTQLEIRTRERIWIDFNPANEFWAHTELVAKRDDVDFIKLNYLDNEGLEDTIISSIEARRGDGNNNWWRVYGLGEIGSLEGNVYEGWITTESIPEGFVLKRYGVDFGFSNDPTAVIAVYENEDGDICLEKEVYETRLLTPQLITKLKSLPPALFVCDNSRPEIIAEMRASGLRAVGCNKTPGEKMNGKRYNIELVQRRKVYFLAEDKEIEQEYLTYAWRKKKSTGEVLDEPVDGNDHAMDAVAYAVRDLAKPTPTIHASLTTASRPSRRPFSGGRIL